LDGEFSPGGMHGDVKIVAVNVAALPKRYQDATHCMISERLPAQQYHLGNHLLTIR
jgi:hypothetical protein